jgi:hypothetical protein
VFNRKAYEFFEEYTSMCKNPYLVKRKKWYFPFHDETSFNVCLWKHNARHSFGNIFVNTHLLNTVKFVEENVVEDKRMGTNLDFLGADWEYIEDSRKVLLYHGFKQKEEMEEALEYLLNG